MADAMDRIVPLDELDDFKVAEGDPDVRGWAVLSSDGKRIGDVDNLLVDTAAMKVRYLDVDLEDDLLVDDEDRHVLVPIGYARLDEDENQVYVDTLRSSDVAALPAYGHQPITREYETSLRSSFDSSYTATGRDENFYEGGAFDESNFYNRGAEVSSEMHLTGRHDREHDVRPVGDETMARDEVVVRKRGMTPEQEMEAERHIEQADLSREDDVDIRSRR